jgi:agmatine deiminase
MPKVKALSSTPRALGFRFPAEWEPHAGTWFSWPRPEGISFPGKYHTVPENLARIFHEVALREHVHVNVPNENYQRIVSEQLIAGGLPKALLNKRVHFHFIPTNEAWCRDHGPAFVQRRVKGKVQTAIVDWGFNAWGGKYPPFDSDDNVPTRVAEVLGKKVQGVFYPRVAGKPVIMEGGAVEFNGAGTVMTTTSCLLHKNRNPHLSKQQIEQALKDYYGQEHVVWLGEGIVGDDTDGHIDDLARFISPTCVVTTVEDDPKDENYKLLRDNLRKLQLAKDQHGKPFTVITIPMPGRVEHDGERLPATYANFSFVNGALLVPTYRHKKNDRVALEILAKALATFGHKREVVGIDCVELIWGLGSIHCLSQQMPRL